MCIRVCARSRLSIFLEVWTAMCCQQREIKSLDEMFDTVTAAALWISTRYCWAQCHLKPLKSLLKEQAMADLVFFYSKHSQAKLLRHFCMLSWVRHVHFTMSTQVVLQTISCSFATICTMFLSVSLWTSSKQSCFIGAKGCLSIGPQMLGQIHNNIA